MLEIKTSIDIDAPIETVWSVLTDTHRYPDWNPFVRFLKGELKEGKRIKVGLPGMTFKPQVLRFRENEEFRWLGHLWIPGLFDGEHYFKVERTGLDRTHLIHGEKFHGILIPVFRKSLLTNTAEGFRRLNEAFKKEAEQKKPAEVPAGF